MYKWYKDIAYAIHAKDEKAVARFIKRHPEQLKTEVEWQKKDKWCGPCLPIVHAVFYGSLPILEMLVAAGSELDGILHLAAERCEVEMAEFLIGCGADPSAKNKDGWLPLAKAVNTYRDVDQERQLEMIELLINKGADPESGMYHAVDRGNLTVVKALLDRGASPNWLLTAVAKVTQNDGLEILKELIRRGADVKYVSEGEDFKTTSLHSLIRAWARAGNYKRSRELWRAALQILLENGAEVRVEDTLLCDKGWSNQRTTHESPLAIAMNCHLETAVWMMLNQEMTQHGKILEKEPGRSGWI